MVNVISSKVSKTARPGFFEVEIEGESGYAVIPYRKGYMASVPTGLTVLKSDSIDECVRACERYYRKTHGL